MKNRKGSDTRRSSKPAASAAPPDLPVAKNDEVVIDIIGMNHDGEGVGRADGYTLFVQGALPGEKARVKVLKTKKQYGYAAGAGRAEPEPHRGPVPDLRPMRRRQPQI